MQADNFNVSVYLYGNSAALESTLLLLGNLCTSIGRGSTVCFRDLKDNTGCLILDERTMVTGDWY